MYVHRLFNPLAMTLSQKQKLKFFFLFRTKTPSLWWPMSLWQRVRGRGNAQRCPLVIINIFAHWHILGSSSEHLLMVWKLANLSYFAEVFIFQVPAKGRSCRTDKDCEKGFWDQQSHGIVASSTSNTCTYILYEKHRLPTRELCSKCTKVQIWFNRKHWALLHLLPLLWVGCYSTRGY